MRRPQRTSVTPRELYSPAQCPVLDSQAVASDSLNSHRCSTEQHALRMMHEALSGSAQDEFEELRRGPDRSCALKTGETALKVLCAELYPPRPSARIGLLCRPTYARMSANASVVHLEAASAQLKEIADARIFPMLLETALMGEYTVLEKDGSLLTDRAVYSQLYSRSLRSTLSGSGGK